MNMVISKLMGGDPTATSCLHSITSLAILFKSGLLKGLARQMVHLVHAGHAPNYQ